MHFLLKDKNQFLFIEKAILFMKNANLLITFVFPYFEIKIL